MIHCHICYTMNVDDDFICDMCEKHYCEECSYIYTLHYQHQGARCHYCSDQRRLRPLDKEVKGKNMVEYWKAMHPKF